MLNFEYYTPTKVVFGKDTENRQENWSKHLAVPKSWCILEDRVQKNPDCWTESAIPWKKQDFPM